MRVRREHRDAIALVRQRQVGDELSRAGGEAPILDTANRLSNTELCHGVPPNAFLNVLFVQ